MTNLVFTNHIILKICYKLFILLLVDISIINICEMVSLSKIFKKKYWRELMNSNHIRAQT